MDDFSKIFFDRKVQKSFNKFKHNNEKRGKRISRTALNKIARFSFFRNLGKKWISIFSNFNFPKIFSIQYFPIQTFLPQIHNRFSRPHRKFQKLFQVPSFLRNYRRSLIRFLTNFFPQFSFSPNFKGIKSHKIPAKSSPIQ